MKTTRLTRRGWLQTAAMMGGLVAVKGMPAPSSMHAQEPTDPKVHDIGSRKPFVIYERF